uniref:Uncharacterized protein n=1 Tax=Rhizophora mucronata TaxID=61149 RepID=A0A2P2NA12_RHIMU
MYRSIYIDHHKTSLYRLHEINH